MLDVLSDVGWDCNSLVQLLLGLTWAVIYGYNSYTSNKLILRSHLTLHQSGGTEN
jgi:hypothetical protein